MTLMGSERSRVPARGPQDAGLGGPVQEDGRSGDGNAPGTRVQEGGLSQGAGGGGLQEAVSGWLSEG